METMKCGHCSVVMGDVTDLRFLEVSSHIIHLILQPEIAKDFITTIANFDKSDGKTRFKCKSCGNRLGCEIRDQQMNFFAFGTDKINICGTVLKNQDKWRNLYRSSKYSNIQVISAPEFRARSTTLKGKQEPSSRYTQQKNFEAEKRSTQETTKHGVDRNRQHKDETREHVDSTIMRNGPQFDSSPRHNASSSSLPPQLRNFYDSCMKMTHIIRSEREANNFFQAIFAFDNKLDLVYNLSDNSLYGKEVLQSALSLCCSNPSNINSTVIKFLDYIGDNILNIGSTKKCVSDLYLIAYHTPGLLSIIGELLEMEQIVDPLVVAWFLVSICRSEATCRENVEVLRIAKILKANGTSVQQLDTLLLCSSQMVSDEVKGMDDNISLEYLRSMQPQHDNDFIDYRKVSIVPTAAEINS
eukprot:gene8494-17521_t